MFDFCLNFVKCCVGHKRNQVSPLNQYMWYGHPTSKCCKNIHCACYAGHFDCLKLLIKYEQSIMDANDLLYHKQSCHYFSWLTNRGTIDMFTFLLFQGYRPSSWSHFFSNVIQSQNLQLLKDIHSTKVLANIKNSWSLEHIYAYYFLDNLREGDLNNPELTKTFLYFLNYGNQDDFVLFQATYPILEIVFRGIEKVPVECFDELLPAMHIVKQCLLMITPSKTESNDYQNHFVLPEKYYVIVDKFHKISLRKQDVIKHITHLNIITKELVLYVVGLYL
jgi:hypothetical protein